MDATKKRILESIGCFVVTAQDFFSFTEAETAFLKRIANISESRDDPVFPVELNANESLEIQNAEVRQTC
jgi:hypothetical protein